MKKALTILAIALMAGSQWSIVNGQSVTVYEKDTPMAFDVSAIDSIIFSADKASNPIYFTSDGRRIVDGHWLSLGTSITWYNNNVSSAFTKGYQTRVMEKLAFKQFTNKGVNAGVLSSALSNVIKADYYTIEHGVNDWGHSTPVGTIEDYKNNTGNGTFAATYRKLIDAIYKVNPKAMIILCTPRKAYGFGSYLPAHWYDEFNGIYLQDYADLIKEIAAYESLPVADWFYECGGQTVMPKLSIDVALHPNDDGHQLMANVLIQAFEKVLIH